MTKTSELLLAAGIVVSTANFLTDGDVMRDHTVLSNAWSWAQAIAIDSSLGIVFINAFQALKERDKIRASMFFLLTALLATVAGLITHFDALGHAAGLPVTDKEISGVIPLWIMTALRAVAVIGFLLASRLKHVSFRELRQGLVQSPEQKQEPSHEATVQQIDYTVLARALVDAMQQVDVSRRVKITEEQDLVLPELGETGDDQVDPNSAMLHGTRTKSPAEGSTLEPGPEDGNQSQGERKHQQKGQYVRGTGTTDEKLASAFEELTHEGMKITTDALSKRARVRKQTAVQWIRQQGTDMLQQKK